MVARKKTVAPEKTGKASREKKAITKKQFERIVQVSSLVVPLVVAVIGSVASITAAYVSHPAPPNPEIRYSLSLQDRKDLDRLRSEFNQAERELSKASTPEVKDALDRRLRRIALDEAEIMRKYDPEFQPRYPSG